MGAESTPKLMYISNILQTMSNVQHNISISSVASPAGEWPFVQTAIFTFSSATSNIMSICETPQLMAHMTFKCPSHTTANSWNEKAILGNSVTYFQFIRTLQSMWYFIISTIQKLIKVTCNVKQKLSIAITVRNR